MNNKFSQRKRLGEILIEAGKIQLEDLELALNKQSVSGKKIGEVLIDLGYVTEDDIVINLALQYKIPFIKLENYSIPEEMLGLIPKSLALKYSCIPIDKIGNAISFIVCDPTNLYDLKQQESFLNCTMNFFLTSPSALNEAINKFYGN